MGLHSESFRFEGGGRQVAAVWPILGMPNQICYFSMPNYSRLFNQHHPPRPYSSRCSLSLCVGLKRTGKSCRLRWVNYLHPGLKRCKMTPHEERLVLDLHSKWGNRWSRIARKLPGRTDNEIKNYWRTHMRKKAQERKRAIPAASSSFSNNSSSSSMSSSAISREEGFPDGKAPMAPSSSISSNLSTIDSEERSFYDTGGKRSGEEAEEEEDEMMVVREKEYSMDDIWKDISLCESNEFFCQTMASPIWNYCPEMLWTTTMTDQEDTSKTLPAAATSDQFFACYDQEISTLTG